VGSAALKRGPERDFIMSRRTLTSAWLFPSVLVVLVAALGACTDPNTMQAVDSHSESRDVDRTPRR
jgi:hypothetical protein